MIFLLGYSAKFIPQVSVADFAGNSCCYVGTTNFGFDLLEAAEETKTTETETETEASGLRPDGSERSTSSSNY